MASKTWRIDHYARLKRNAQKDPMKSDQKKSEWQSVTSSSNKSIFVVIKAPLNIVLQHGDDVLESFTLVDSSKWLRVMVRDDIMLFFIKRQSGVRNFRIKFTSNSASTSKDQCENFARSITPYVQVQIVKSKVSSQVTGSQISGEKSDTTNPKNAQGTGEEDSRRLSLANLTKTVLSGSLDSLPSYYRSGNLQLDESEGPSLIKTCLLDPSFPGFVEEVEKQLKTMTEVE